MILTVTTDGSVLSVPIEGAFIRDGLLIYRRTPPLEMGIVDLSVPTLIELEDSSHDTDR